MVKLRDLSSGIGKHISLTPSTTSKKPKFRDVYICIRALATVDPKVTHVFSQYWGVRVGEYIHEIRKDKDDFDLWHFWDRTSTYKKTQLNDPSWVWQRSDYIYKDVYMGETSKTDAEIMELGSNYAPHYSLLSRNCQHFSHSLYKLICDKPAPSNELGLGDGWELRYLTSLLKHKVWPKVSNAELLLNSLINGEKRKKLSGE